MFCLILLPIAPWPCRIARGESWHFLHLECCCQCRHPRACYIMPPLPWHLLQNGRVLIFKRRPLLWRISTTVCMVMTYANFVILKLVPLLYMSHVAFDILHTPYMSKKHPQTGSHHIIHHIYYLWFIIDYHMTHRWQSAVCFGAEPAVEHLRRWHEHIWIKCVCLRGHSYPNVAHRVFMSLRSRNCSQSHRQLAHGCLQVGGGHQGSNPVPLDL